MADRPYHHGHLRATLLANAERALAERGPGALSLRELAREAGVSHAAPGRHFRDKQALLDALALNGFQRLNDALARASTDGQDARSRMGSLARAYLSFARDNAALLDLMYTRKHDSDIPEQLTGAIDSVLTTVVHCITEGQRRGEVTDGDPTTIAYTIAATLHGFSALTPNQEMTAQRDAWLDEVIALLFTGISPR
ncbi:TetR/AcrR family transcriptional regulator [Lipingzhangella sp. LS1_29]|uniref:TetR/AcrR family transcriptional regulator n=1 Tax=Lipingzhangella rawalii TaxID=2055835 RepID=A0ABU2HAP5_9ACTN|nr:TetR/AcrR family transcriptional regulator [Lipingzhangella rawalii]MDS1272396.1 TetR/AcrR family transcriptional regulator [Lipingzhangella rawalii]